MEFHISRRSREKFDFDETLFAYNGNIIFANFHAARKFAYKLNLQRDLATYPESAAKTSHINAMGLIDEIFHHIFQLYRERRNPEVLTQALAFLDERLTPTMVDAFLELFINEFPPNEVYKKKSNARMYLHGLSGGKPNRELLIEEFVMLWLAIENPALANYQDLFIVKSLTDDIRFRQITTELQNFFALQPYFGPKNIPLTQMLRSPAIEVPDSITGQLEYIRENWASLLGDYLYRLLTSLDLINEENKLHFSGPGITPIPVYDQDEFARAGGSAADVEAFSKDRDWMPRLVLIAKNTYIWLDQLSKKYQTEVRRLDQIPQSELDTLASWGITGLWLIGLWERSPASARIKQLCGNPEAISSAYSLHSYQIAADLGGEPAYEALRDNAARSGIRLASDMVPNHMGIDSDWVIHNPDRFLSLDYCPYPSYTFNGENLSSDPNVSIQIEDHYYDRTDAAVVFKRHDKNSGQVKYIYHGNDGTSMPWNDTAQLNYLNPAVREAVIQTILEVARRFPIIRFDAAMTLAKKHFQRLWFPQPGTGGAIPSRSDHSMTMDEFNHAMPEEFWREVVNRAAVEAPDTLLLAEAFWLMEGYFVRTLGMHRVYNSAFMNMLRNEDNAGYRKLIRNTLEFEPEILKRYVNFMNNPDERTAAEQFGKGDKYFGICTLMATMPGLPMLGHGQIEGYSEKYGMEYRKAYWDEQIDNDLVARHEWEIFPLLHQRKMFSGVEQFNLYDFVTPFGGVNENVYAYSNYEDGNAALVVFNNKFDETEGWIKDSIPQLRRYGSEKNLERVSLANALHLNGNNEAYLIFTDQVTRLQFLRPLAEVYDKGLYFKLRGYQYHTFLNFRVVQSSASHDYAALYHFTHNQGVPDLDQALRELVLKPVLEPFRSIVNQGYLGYLFDKYLPGQELDSIEKREIPEKISNFLNGVSLYSGADKERSELILEVSALFNTCLTIHGALERRLPVASAKVSEIGSLLCEPLRKEKFKWVTLLTWALCSRTGKLINTIDFADQSLSWLDEMHLIKPFSETLQNLVGREVDLQRAILLLRIGISHQNWYEETSREPLQGIVKNWFTDPEVQSYLQVNRHKDVLWFNKEAFNEFTWWMALLTLCKHAGEPSSSSTHLSETLLHLGEIISDLRDISEKSGYKFDQLFELATR